jgi:hypothetical protein
MSLTVESIPSQEVTQERLAFERYRVQSVFETHSRRPDIITDVVSEYINAVHVMKPSHIFEPIERNDSKAIAIGITEELEQLINPISKKLRTPHSGEVYGIFVDYITDEYSVMLRQDVGVSALPRALTMTLSHFILDGIIECDPISNS